MKDYQAMAEAFKLQYEKFLTGCDALEAEGRWDTAALGEMEGYYFNDIMTVILHLISADGRFSEEEARFVADAFGFRYTAGELAQLYREQSDEIDRFFREEVPQGYRKMQALSPSLAEHYRDLLLQAGELAAQASDDVARDEQRLMDVLKAALG